MTQTRIHLLMCHLKCPSLAATILQSDDGYIGYFNKNISKYHFCILRDVCPPFYQAGESTASKLKARMRTLCSGEV